FRKCSKPRGCNPWACAPSFARSLVDLWNAAPMYGAGTHDIESQRREGRKLGMVDDVEDVVQSQHLPLVQADQDVPANNPAAACRTIGIHFHNRKTAVELLTRARYQLASDRSKFQTELAP